MYKLFDPVVSNGHETNVHVSLLVGEFFFFFLQSVEDSIDRVE